LYRTPRPDRNPHPESAVSETHPWQPGDTPEEQAQRREAYQRLVDAARRIGMPVERLGSLLRQVNRNEEETRRFLSGEVYGVPDDLLDDLVRIRLEDLASDE
jgi:hypothetical protein